MTRFALLLVVVLTFGFMTGSPSIAEDPAISTNPAPEVSAEPAQELELQTEFELQTELLYTPADPRKDTSSFGPEIFMPTTGLYICDDHEEQMYCGGCPCMVIRNVVTCWC